MQYLQNLNKTELKNLTNLFSTILEEHRKVLSLRPVKHIFEENVLLMEKKHISVVYVISFTIRRKSDVEVHCKITLREDKFLSLYLNSK